MSLSEIEQVMSESSDCRFANLRGVRWRVNLGVLPSLSSSVDEFRRATADCRRRYALLRRRLLMDPHINKDDRDSSNRFIDNPLSQNPNSTWGQFFRNAELEKTLDQDLSRLYPEHWCYFQAPGCQGMLRRILLLWCLKHPEYGYRQGMHELLAPLLYVLHVDIMRLSEVRKNYEDYFTDKFDGLSFEERDITYTFGVLDSMNNEIDTQGYSRKSLDELDPEVQCIVMMSDSYGAESELGIVLSEKFMEHDAYCMFDAFMSGNHGCVAMAGFFGYSPASSSHTGLPPVLEACTAFYRLLAIVDPSLYNHLVELGVEPQYFGLRWLRVLFGREFLLQDLLLVWDEIFSAENSVRVDSKNHRFMIFDSPRGSLIAGMAVSMILNIRSSLLSTENATCCLQRLLNFPENIDLNKIIHKAKSLQALVLDTNMRSALSLNGVFDQRSSIPARTKSLPFGSTSPKSPLFIAPESYWEEKWREHKAEEEERKIVLRKPSLPTQKKKRWSKITKLFRAVTDLSHYKIGKRVANSSPVTRSSLEDLSQQHSPVLEEANARNNLIDVDCLGTLEKEDDALQETEEGVMDFHSADEESLISGDASSEENSEPTSIVSDSKYVENDSDNDKSVVSPSEENSSVSSEPMNPARDSFCIGNDSESITGSTSVRDENDKGQETSVDLPLFTEDDTADKSVADTKEHKILPEIFQWFWKFGRSLSSKETPNRNTCDDATKTNGVESNKNQMGCYTESHPQALSSGSNGDSDQNLVKTLKNLGQSMLEHIQAIESVFQQELGPAQAGFIGNLAKPGVIGKGQVTATIALKELRKISNLLSEM